MRETSSIPQPHTATLGRRPAPAALRWGMRLFAVALAALHAWAAATSYSMNPDGTNYLDIGDAYWRGDWATAVNTVWSPLYSWLLGAVLGLLNPPMRWEFGVVHAVNFGIFLLALVAFEFLWRTLWQALSAGPTLQDGAVIWPEWTWWSIGYLLFTWAALSLIQIWAVTPDLLMAVFVFAAAGFLVKIRAGDQRMRTFLLFGLALGAGYLSKSIMFPVALLFLAASFFAVATGKGSSVARALPRTATALVAFLLLALPFIILMGVVKDQWTYGETGKYTYVRHVNGVAYPHWQGEPSGDGTPTHPSRRILENPPIYEFGTPIGGTYPISHDQTYWYDGVVVRFDLVSQVHRLLASAVFYADLFLRQQGALLFGVLLLYALAWRGMWSLVRGARGLLLTLIGLAVMLLYAPILVEGRYVGAFVVLFWGDLLGGARLPAAPQAPRLLSVVGVLMAGFLFANIVVFNLQGFGDLTDNRAGNAPAAGAPSWPGAVAEALHAEGVRPGAKVAVIGYGFDAFWARLARTKIVAEMLPWQADPFWHGGNSAQAEVLDAFARAGAQAVVAEYVPASADLAGKWRQVEDSSFYLYVFD